MQDKFFSFIFASCSVITISFSSSMTVQIMRILRITWKSSRYLSSYPAPNIAPWQKWHTHISNSRLIYRLLVSPYCLTLTWWQADIITNQFISYLLILPEAGESLVESRHEVQRVIGQALESFGDAVCTSGNHSNHQLGLFIQYMLTITIGARWHFVRVY